MVALIKLGLSILGFHLFKLAARRAHNSYFFNTQCIKKESRFRYASYRVRKLNGIYCEILDALNLPFILPDFLEGDSGFLREIM